MSTMVKIWTWWTWTSQLKHNSWLSWWGKMLLILPTVTTIARCVLHRDVRGSRRWDHFESQFFQTSFSHGGLPGFVMGMVVIHDLNDSMDNWVRLMLLRWDQFKQSSRYSTQSSSQAQQNHNQSWFISSQAPHNPFNRPPQQYLQPYRCVFGFAYSDDFRKTKGTNKVNL